MISRSLVLAAMVAFLSIPTPAFAGEWHCWESVINPDEAPELKTLLECRQQLSQTPSIEQDKEAKVSPEPFVDGSRKSMNQKSIMWEVWQLVRQMLA